MEFVRIFQVCATPACMYDGEPCCFCVVLVFTYCTVVVHQLLMSPILLYLLDVRWDGDPPRARDRARDRALTCYCYRDTCYCTCYTVDALSPP